MHSSDAKKLAFGKACAELDFHLEIQEHLHNTIDCFWIWENTGGIDCYWKQLPFAWLLQ